MIRSFGDCSKKAGLSGLFLYGVLIAGFDALSHQVLAAPLLLEIARADAGYDRQTRQPFVTLTLKDTSRRIFADFTAANIGRTIEIRVDGRVVMKPVIREPIAGGIVQVAGGLSADEAKTMAERLTSGVARLDVEAMP